MDSFQEVIKEDIRELVSELPCLFCRKHVLLKELGGIKHARGNILDLQDPICSNCWKTKKLDDIDRFSSVDDVLSKAEGTLSKDIKLITIEKEEDKVIAKDELEKPVDWGQVDCPHEYKILSTNKVECRLCYKRFSLMAD